MENKFIITREVIEECLKECFDDNDNSKDEKVSSGNKN